jgi:hypothetical protein
MTGGTRYILENGIDGMKESIIIYEIRNILGGDICIIKIYR